MSLAFVVVGEVTVDDAYTAQVEAIEAWAAETCPNPHPKLDSDHHWMRGHDGDWDIRRCTGCGSTQPRITHTVRTATRGER